MRLLLLAALLAAALPARAGFGFVYANAPDATMFEPYRPSMAYQHNSVGGTNTVIRHWTGYYEVRMPGLMPTGRRGNVQVTAYGDDSTYCKARSWSRVGDFDVSIIVQCYDDTAAPRNSRFTAVYHDEQVSADALAYTRLDRPDPATWPAPPGPMHYVPPMTDTFNTRSPGDPAGDLWIRARGTGRYTVYIHGWWEIHANFLVTATGGSVARCAIANEVHERAAVDEGYRIDRFAVDVRCVKPDAVPIDSSFSFAFFNKRTLNGGAGAYLRSDVVTYPSDDVVPRRERSFNSAFGRNAVRAVDRGLYVVRLGDLAGRYTKSTVIITALGARNEHCKLRSWVADGRDVKVTVACFTGPGALAPVPFFLHFGTDA
jgi:hypothetical protein